MGNTQAATLIAPKVSLAMNSNVAAKFGRGTFQNFLLVWLDANIDENNLDFKISLAELRRVVASIHIFRDPQQCINFIEEIENERVFLIVSGSLGQQIVPKIERFQQIESIYVFCNNKSAHEKWARKMLKVKGVHASIQPICEALRMGRTICDRNLVSISFHTIDPLFMYTQLLKESILKIEDDDDKSINDFVEFCRLQTDVNAEQLEQIKREYRNYTPIWWYTGETFLHSMLNRGLRLMDVDIIMKMGFFIRHLHRQIQTLYTDQKRAPTSKTQGNFTVFRGQGLPLAVFEQIKNSSGGLMCFNNFLSTSLEWEVSLKQFARPAARQGPDMIGILFVITVDSKICEKANVPYADVSQVGFYKGSEAEILFTTHTIFQIKEIQRLVNEYSEPVWEIQLTLTGNENNELKELTNHLKREINSTGWQELGLILIKMGVPAKAEQLYEDLLVGATTDRERSVCLNQLGLVYSNVGEYSKAVTFFQRCLEIDKRVIPPKYHNLASSYNNIGLAYENIGEYSKALESHQEALLIKRKILPQMHADLAASYNNIGNVHYNMSNYSKALESYQQAHAILKIDLPPNHPGLANSHSNIGAVYDEMGIYSEALNSHQQALQIRKIALPANHPDLAASYNNIGLVYNNMREYCKALDSHQQALSIKLMSLPSNHPGLANSYNSMGLVYENLKDYPKALTYYQKAQYIWQKKLPSNHPDVIMVKRNIKHLTSKM